MYMQKKRAGDSLPGLLWARKAGQKVKLGMGQPEPDSRRKRDGEVMVPPRHSA